CQPLHGYLAVGCMDDFHPVPCCLNGPRFMSIDVACLGRDNRLVGFQRCCYHDQVGLRTARYKVDISVAIGYELGDCCFSFGRIGIVSIADLLHERRLLKRIKDIGMAAFAVVITEGVVIRDHAFYTWIAKLSEKMRALPSLNSNYLNRYFSPTMPPKLS